MEADIKAIEKELFFIDGVAEITNREGYNYNGKALFGTKVGPIHSITDGLLHEIAHVAELQKIGRIEQYGFGLQIKTRVEVLGKSYPEPITWNATKLELRVILWQDILCKHFGYNFDPKEFSTSLQYMPDFICVPKKGYKFDGEAYVNSSGIKFTGTLKESNGLRMQSMWDYMDEQKSTGQYTYESFRKRWDKVFLYLKTL